MKFFTDFAPPERLDKDKILNEYQFISESTAFFGKELFNRIPVIILILNKHRQIVFANKYFTEIAQIDNIEDILGLRPGEVLGCKDSTINPAGCGTSKFCKYCGAVNAILSSLKGISDVRECDILLKDENALNLMVSAEPIKFNNDDYIVFTVQNISYEKEKNYLEKVIFSNLRESISEIKVGLNMLHGEYKNNELLNQISKIADNVLHEIDLQKIVVDIANYKIEINPSTINSIELLNDVVENFNLKEEKIIIEESDNVEFISDYYLVFVVLQQIIKNGLDVRFENEKIKLSAKKQNENIVFLIKNKRYIPEKTQYLIFQKSFSHSMPGHGINAYVSKFICKNYLQGDVEFTTEKDKGTTFYLTLPLKLKENKCLLGVINGA